MAAALLSAIAFSYFYSRGVSNIYPDGVARVNIARKVVDHPDASIRQRYMQIGTPWLPLQTVLMLPLAANDYLWRSGAAGSFVSMFFFVIAAIGLFSIAKNLYSSGVNASTQAGIAIGAFLLNPGILYMQSTPMTEVPFIGAMAAAAALLQRWLAGQSTSRLVAASIAMTLATLVRYEAWPAAALGVAIVFSGTAGNLKKRIPNALLSLVLTAIGPLYWFWHNWAVFGDALAFFRGPHSARGIYSQHQATLGWAEVLVANPLLDIAIMTAAVAVCAGPLLLILASFGLIGNLKGKDRFFRLAPVVFLGLPFLFHIFSLYRGEIQIFPLSAFGLLNIRYGLPHVAVVCLLVPGAAGLLQPFRGKRGVLVVSSLVVLQYFLLLSGGPSQVAVYQEAYRNGVNSRSARELTRVAAHLKANPPGRHVLMYSGGLGPLVPQSGLTFSRIIHEGTSRWHSIEDSIPADVSTVIFENDDPLHIRITGNNGLARELAEEFNLRLSVGQIKVWERRPSNQSRWRHFGRRNVGGVRLAAGERFVNQCLHSVTTGRF